MNFYYIFLEALCGWIGILPLFIIYQCCFYGKKGKKSPSSLHFMMLLGFAFVLAGIFSATGIPALRDVHFDPNVNLKIYFFDKGLSTQNRLNIILFAPFGFFLPLLWKRFRFFPLTVVSGFLFSFAIEVTQMFNYRTTDMEDLVLNTAGAAVGYLIFMIMRLLLPRFMERLHSGKAGGSVKEMLGCVAVAWCGMFFLAPYISQWAWEFFF